jgi:hypothetical protein
VRDLAVDDFARHTLYGRGDVVNQTLTLALVEQAKQVAGLSIVVIAVTAIVTFSIAANSWTLKHDAA